MAEDFRERREVDSLFGHACSEAVAEVVENQIQLDAGACAFSQRRPCALFTLETCRPGFRLEGKIQGDFATAIALSICFSSLSTERIV
jgi:hypothetical protein